MIAISKTIAVISLAVLIAFLCGYGFARTGKSSTKNEIKKDLIGENTELSYRINNACGKGYEMYDWYISAGDIIISCASTKANDGGTNWYPGKTVSIRR